jgi:hypothetical protein
MNTLHAIETKYKGYLFRSRVEARWAVFFDACGMLWQYELEGYELPGGLRYLPDFWLPQIRMFAEVKALAFTDEEIQKCRLLAKASGRSVLMLDGPPDCRSYWAVELCGERDPNGKPGDTWFMDYAFSDEQYWKSEHRLFCCCSPGYPAIDWNQGYSVEAVAASRCARFEFGDAPCTS